MSATAGQRANCSTSRSGRTVESGNTQRLPSTGAARTRRARRPTTRSRVCSREDRNMARESKIEWTDATFNPWIGCERVAPECDNCYAAARSKRVGEAELWEGHRRRTTADYWRGPLKWARTLPAELGRRPRVFCASLADVFDNRVPAEWFADLVALIRATPELDWLLLTKRVTRAAHCLERLEGVPANVWLGISAGTRQA